MAFQQNNNEMPSTVCRCGRFLHASAEARRVKNLKNRKVDFDKNLSPSTEFHGVEDADTRRLATSEVDGHPVYFLDNQRRSNKIEIIRLKEFLANKLNLQFALQPADPI